MTNRKRKKYKKVRVTDLENEFINQKVAKSTVSDFQTFCLTMLIQGEVKTVDYTSLNQLVGEVKRIGVNINQVVRLANQFSEISNQDIKDLTTTIARLTQLVESTLQEELRKGKNPNAKEDTIHGLYKTLPDSFI